MELKRATVEEILIQLHVELTILSLSISPSVDRLEALQLQTHMMALDLVLTVLILALLPLMVSISLGLVRMLSQTLRIQLICTQLEPAIMFSTKLLLLLTQRLLPKSKLTLVLLSLTLAGPPDWKSPKPPQQQLLELMEGLTLQDSLVLARPAWTTPSTASPCGALPSSTGSWQETYQLP